MPELPEVETFKKYGEKHFQNREIKGIEVDDERILWVPRRAMDNLIGRSLTSFSRRGKYIYAETDRQGLYLILHFGMTGYLKAHESRSDRPKGTRVDFTMKEGCVAFVNPRKFGRVGLTDDIAGFFENKGLGEDALTIDEGDFLKSMQGRKGPVKSRLMDQKAVAGIGNIYADEILFQCGIHPESSAEHLKPEDWKKIYRIMRSVFALAIQKEANYKDFPKDYLLYDRSLERSNPPLKRIKVGGRTTFYCPERQKTR